MKTQLKFGIIQPRALLSTKHPLPTALMVCNKPIEPTCFTEANKHPKWRHAMSDEYNALKCNGTWTLIPRHPSMNIVGCKWVFHIKRRADGSID